MKRTVCTCLGLDQRWQPFLYHHGEQISKGLSTVVPPKACNIRAEKGRSSHSLAVGLKLEILHQSHAKQWSFVSIVYKTAATQSLDFTLSSAAVVIDMLQWGILILDPGIRQRQKRHATARLALDSADSHPLKILLEIRTLFLNPLPSAPLALLLLDASDAPLLSSTRDAT